MISIMINVIIESIIFIDDNKEINELLIKDKDIVKARFI